MRTIMFAMLCIALMLNGCVDDWRDPIVKPAHENEPQVFPNPHAVPPQGAHGVVQKPPPPPSPFKGAEWVSQGEIKFLVTRDGNGVVDFDNIIPAEIQKKGQDARIIPLFHPYFWALDRITDEQIFLTSPRAVCSPHHFPDAQTQLDHWAWFPDGTTLVSLTTYPSCPGQIYAASYGAGENYQQLSADIINPEVIRMHNFGDADYGAAQVARRGNSLLVVRVRTWDGIEDFTNDPDFANREELCWDMVEDPSDPTTFEDCMSWDGARWQDTPHAVNYPLPDRFIISNPFMERVFGGGTVARTRMRRAPQIDALLVPLGLQIEHPPQSNKWYWLDSYVERTFTEVPGELETAALTGQGFMEETHNLRRELYAFNAPEDRLQSTPFVFTYYDEKIYDGRHQELLYDADPLERDSPTDTGFLWRRVYRAETEAGNDLLFWFNVGRFLPAR